jgi:hypothetical protein
VRQQHIVSLFPATLFGIKADQDENTLPELDFFSSTLGELVLTVWGRRYLRAKLPRCPIIDDVSYGAILS